jgi:putative DNA primase/helicase
LDLNGLNFKLVPLGFDAKTPAVESTEAIYNNPDYWNQERIKTESYRFKNVATMLGKTRIGTYRNELDIDSEGVANILSNLAGKNGSYSLVLDSQAKTFVVKTKKPYGYRIYWDSTKQNKTIHTSDCKKGFEFEIKTDLSGGHSTLPGSSHRDDPNFHYTNIGQNKVILNDQIYEELLNVLKDCLKPTKEAEETKHSSKDVELTHDEIQKVADAIIPYYVNSHRNDLVFALSGLLRRFNISFDSSLNILQQIIKDDEEKRSRIDTLEQTYKKRPMDVCGSKYFTSVLESIIGADKAKAEEILNQILAIIARRKKKETMIALEILEQHKFATIEETDEILYYYGGVYKHGGEIAIKKIIEGDYLDDAKINLRREVLDHIRCLTYQPRNAFDADINIINLKNGLYHITEDKLTEHDPNYLSLNQKTIFHNPEAVPKRFIRFLNEIVYTSDVDTLVDLMGYTFHRDNPLEIITYLHGFGGNGKSVLFNLLTALHGDDNVSHVSMRTILERPFGLYELVDKDVNLDSELSNAVIHDTAIVKKITGREITFVEGKHKTGFDTKLHAKVWFSCNKIPQIVDPTNADYRRSIYLDFPNTFEDNPNLIKELTTEDELSGIFNVMMNTLRRVLVNGKITMDDATIEKRIDKYERLTNPVKAFIDEISPETDEDDPIDYTDTITKPALHYLYEHFCKKYKLAAMSETKFGTIMKDQLGYSDAREGPRKYRKRVWKGITLNDEYKLVVEQGRQTKIIE